MNFELTYKDDYLRLSIATATQFENFLTASMQWKISVKNWAEHGKGQGITEEKIIFKDS